MGDICKCYGENCPLREHCYRFKVPSHPYWQSFSDFTTCLKKTEDGYECEYYLSIN